MPAWLDKFVWLRYGDKENIMWCETCRTYADHADKTSSLFQGTDTFRIEPLQAHNRSPEHIACELKHARMRHSQSESQSETHSSSQPLGPMDKVLQKLDHEADMQLQFKFNTAYHISKYKLAFSHMGPLCDLQEKNGVKMGERYRNDKKAKEFIHSIADVETARIADQVASARFISVLSDGSTDNSITEQEAVYVRYVYNGQVYTRLANIVALSSASAVGIEAGIYEALHSVGLGREQIRNKLVCINLDGASVNQGKKGGVAKKIKDDIPHAVVSTWCINHKLELAVLDAMKSTAAGSNTVSLVEEVVELVFRFYYTSPKRRRGLAAIAEVIEEDPVYLSGYSGTRWSASRLRAYQALIQHYQAVAMHLEETSVLRNADGPRAQGILRKLRSLQFVHGIHFMVDILRGLSDMSHAWQNERNFVTDIRTKLDEGLLHLEGLKAGDGESEEDMLMNYDSASKDYKGVTLTTKPRETEETCRTKMVALTGVLQAHLNQRFQFLDQPPFKQFAALDHRSLPLPNSSAELYAFGNVAIIELSQYFGEIFSKEEQAAMPREWRALKSRIVHQKHLRPVDVYENICQESPENLSNIMGIIHIALTVSCSTAVVERGFSLMKACKDKFRSRLSQKSLQDLMRVNLIKCDMKSFDPKPAMAHWISSSKRPRRILSDGNPKQKKAIRPSEPTNDDAEPLLPQPALQLLHHQSESEDSAPEFEAEWILLIKSTLTNSEFLVSTLIT